MADKRCENGHFIDESWDLCPYCPAENAESDVPVVRPTRFGAGDPPRPVAVPAEPVRRPTAVPPPTMNRLDSAVALADQPIERTVAVQKLDPLAQPKRYVVGWLIGLNGVARGESFPVRIGRNVLGRDRRSDIVVNDDQASSHHADLVFRPEERRFILMDHNSTNGTYVNDTEIEPRRDLDAKDVVRVGSHKYLFMPLCNEGFYWDEEGALK
ncbi:MAG TPA: FHA domain-containing protein [Thermoanaerobaculia bacterium]|nr:FHA domain-containing protein [Thermoanaerobaculia bacterium]